MSVLWNIFIIVSLFAVTLTSTDDYYDLLGISKDADNREIRKAFKKLAITLHPDKNKDDPEAHEKFVKLTKAYEVLKDEDSRKKYDLYGDEDSSKKKGHYHSWTYYHDQFGIYDDDPEIITLNKPDFEQSVINSERMWFINFYSPMCSHCHDLAPAWRRLARALEGALRIGAVNCEEDLMLCQQEGVHSYPTLILYPSHERYDGDRETDEMLKYVLRRLQTQVVDLCSDNFEDLTQKDESLKELPWLIFFSHRNSIEYGHEHESRQIVAAILDGLVTVGHVDCETQAKLCKRLDPTSSLQYYGAGKVVKGKSQQISSDDTKEIATEILSKLPEATILDREGFEDMKMQLTLGSKSNWLVYFHLGEMEGSLELKKLPALLTSFHIGRINCIREATLCQEMHINRYPMIAVFKSGGAVLRDEPPYEFHHGRRDSAPDLADFARESAEAPYVRSLTPSDFVWGTRGLRVNSPGSWVVDFFAPWCPPCLRLIPEFRRASRALGGNVSLGMVDCTTHVELCRSRGIRSYPTLMLFTSSGEDHTYQGGHTARDLVEFVRDMLDPIVLKLTEDNFYTNVGKKLASEMWIVDFFAPWCGPCQQLAPQWRKLAKMVSDMENVHIGEVNCEMEAGLCGQQGIRSYPTIRLYPMGSKGLSQTAIYSGFHRDADSLRQWLFNFVPSVVQHLPPEYFEERVLQSSDPWLVDFYAPWCGHCHRFAPEFEVVAQKLAGRVKAGKVDCEAYRQLCQRVGIRGYPTLRLYRGSLGHEGAHKGSYYGEDVGSQSSSQILSHVERVLWGTSGQDSYHQHNYLHDEF
ncbi:dnaJ homolog subfamily C member 10-like [Hetaerina americana]|uniref:dnaJ homolog subfamily C member 10-like n=1 Tax=Hetaerina americana TaxID=62018 RepID=UPI003A7F5E7F